ncbi:STAS/SEC14 domain-containing protein [Litoribacillus peritrichatus]|uniref:STAS/SEC14 domain-containing protein n=1 Tax=Litoribacillus peritrichatus TaxID=718191 RepID=A0ABP7MKS9_9GAMM
MANQHGHTDITRQGQLFICRPQGGFNMEGAKEYERYFAQEIAHVIARPWAVMEVLDNFETAGPEVMTRFGAQFAWAAQNNCQWLAVVSKSQMMNFLVEQYIGSSGLEMKIFDDEAAALSWLEQHLSPTVSESQAGINQSKVS